MSERLIELEKKTVLASQSTLEPGTYQIYCSYSFGLMMGEKTFYESTHELEVIDDLDYTTHGNGD